MGCCCCRCPLLCYRLIEYTTYMVGCTILHRWSFSYRSSRLTCPLFHVFTVSLSGTRPPRGRARFCSASIVHYHRSRCTGSPRTATLTMFPHFWFLRKHRYANPRYTIDRERLSLNTFDICPQSAVLQWY